MTIDFHKLLPAPMEIEVVDVWPPGTLTEAAMDAYDRLCRDGRIISRGATRDRSGRVVVRYMADIPAQWDPRGAAGSEVRGEADRIE